MIKVLFFAKLRETLGCADCTVTLKDDVTTVQALRENLLVEHPAWRDALSAPNIIVAVNQEVAALDSPVGNGDEVAFFPPVTGG